MLCTVNVDGIVTLNSYSVLSCISVILYGREPSKPATHSIARNLVALTGQR